MLHWQRLYVYNVYPSRLLIWSSQSVAVRSRAPLFHCRSLDISFQAEGLTQKHLMSLDIAANVPVPDEEEIDSLTKSSLVMNLNTWLDTLLPVSTTIHESVLPSWAKM